MIQIELNGRNMKTKEIAHGIIKEKLNAPEYYGKNLDALWDIVMETSQPIQINLINKDDLIENLEDYGKNIITVFQDAEKENKNIKFQVVDV